MRDDSELETRAYMGIAEIPAALPLARLLCSCLRLPAWLLWHRAGQAFEALHGRCGHLW